jgi:sec-independent protein translocase protein TatA
MFENLSLPHLLMVLAVAILVFGPKRIPEIAGSMGKGIREFKRHISEASGPESPAESSALSRSATNERQLDASTNVSRTCPPESSERGEPKRLLD